MSFTPDQVTIDDSPAIQYPELHTKILQMATNAMILQRLFVVDPIVKGRTRTYVKEAGNVAVGIDRKAIGAPSPRDFTPLTSVSVTPDTYGEEVEIPIEMITDFELGIVDTQLLRLAFRTAYQIELDCYTAIKYAGDNNGTTFAATGKTIGLTGTEFTISGGLGLEDLNHAARLQEQKNFIMNYIAVNPIQKESLKNLPVPSLYRALADPLTGKVEETLGSWTILTSNLIPAGTAFAISDGQNPNNNYAPMGFMVTKQEITTDIDIQKRLRKVIPFTSYRKTPYVANGYCITEITGMTSS
jgi:hypothetical protein